MKKLAKALALAAEAFKDTLDKGGQPYFLHCLRVMNDCGSKDEDVLCAALLHDYIEDAPNRDEHDSRVETVASLGIKTLNLVLLLTHYKENQTYEQYIRSLSGDPDSARIKRADLRDNSNITRLKGLRKKDFDRLEKYHQAYTYLSDL